MIRHRLLAHPRGVLLAVTAVVSAAALAAPAAASAQTAAPARQVTAPRQVATAAAPGGHPSLTLPGLHAASYIVTLITGDQVRLTAEGSGKYAVDPTPATRPDGSATSIQFTDTGGRDGSIYAVPSDATSLLAAGRVSMQLFDLSYLARHGDTGRGGHLPVTLRYAVHPPAGRLARAAARLPGAAVTSVTPSGQVNLRVGAGQASAFWAALTEGPPTSGLGKERLAGALKDVTLDGAVTSATTGRPASAPLYTLTEDVTARDSAADCAINGQTICTAFPSYLIDISTGSTTAITPTSQACVNSPCSVMQIQWSVPAGVYMASNTFSMYSGSRVYTIFAPEPQITVTDNTTLAIDLNDAQPVTINTPHPSETYTNGVFADYRNYPTPSSYLSTASITASAYGFDDFWAVPTQPVTVGTFKTAFQLFLGKPYLTMSVKAPEPITLNAIYSDEISFPGFLTRFSGRKTMPLVYAGVGSKQDYTGRNVHGKLVLVRMNPHYCAVTVGQLNNALNAGAAGVLIDPANPKASLGYCTIPLTVLGPSGPPKTVPKMPFANLPLDQANMLIGLLGQGPVTISVADGGITPYLYKLYLQQENTIPGSLTYDMTARQLALVNTSFHQGSPTNDADFWEAAGPDEFLVANAPYEFSGPASIQEYYGPVSPDTADVMLPAYGLKQSALTPMAADLFTRPSTSAQDWGELPAGAVGTFGVSAKVNQAVPGLLSYLCAACRQGDMFYPEMYKTYPEAGMGYVTGYVPRTITLYMNGQLVQQTPVEGFAAYQLPPQQAKYQLIFDQGKAGTTTWNYSSAQPASGRAPGGSVCIGTELGSADPCQAVPLIFLRYNAGLNLDNEWTAPGSYPLQITAYHQEPGAPAVTGLTLWTSTNGGATWKKAAVTSQGDSSYTSTITVPKLSSTSGTVSLKVQAQDAGGNNVTQVLYNAWKLAAASN